MSRPDIATIPEFNGKHILIAEDEPFNFYYLKELLKPTGAIITWARDGNEAINLFEECLNTVDCVLMDIKMPLISGVEVMRYIKKIRTDIPVIAQTAYAMKGERDEYLNMGFDEYLAKPILKKDLMNILEEYLIKKVAAR